MWLVSFSTLKYYKVNDDEQRRWPTVQLDQLEKYAHFHCFEMDVL